MTETLAKFEGGGEALAGKLALAEPQVSETAKVETLRLAPCVGAVWFFGAVERVASVLQSFACVAGGEQRLGEGEPEVDREFSEATRVCEEDASLRFGNSLGIIPEMQLKLAGRVEAAELEFDVTRAVGEGTGVVQVLASLGGTFRKEEPGEEGIATAEGILIAVPDRRLPVGFGLTVRPGPVTSKKLALCLQYAGNAEQGHRLPVQLHAENRP